MEIREDLEEWGGFRRSIVVAALLITVLAPLFAAQAGHFGWGIFPLAVCIVLFTFVIPAVVLGDLLWTYNNRQPNSEPVLGKLRSYFLLMGAWWAGVVLLILLLNVLSRFFW